MNQENIESSAVSTVLSGNYKIILSEEGYVTPSILVYSVVLRTTSDVLFENVVIG